MADQSWATINPITGQPYQFSDATTSNGSAYNPKLAGSDWSMDGSAYGAGSGDSGGGAGFNDYHDDANIIGALGGSIQGLGYTGNLIDKGQGGDSGSADSVDPGMVDWLNQNGYNIGVAPNNTDASGGSSIYGLFKDGKAVAAPTNIKADDGSFGAAWLAATAFAGAAAAGAFSGAGGLGADGAGGVANAEGAYPSSLGGGSLGDGAGGIANAEGAYPTSIGGVNGSNSMDQYLLNGASDGSTIGGQGGYAGAVGSNAAPEILGSTGGASTSFGLPSLGQGLKDIGKIVGGSSGSGTGGSNLLGLLGGGSGQSAGDMFRQQLTAQALRDPQQTPNQAPGWVPATPGGAQNARPN